MNDQRRIRFSKFISLVLRHNPAHIGITLDDQGWVEVDQLLAGAGRRGVAMSREQLEIVVAACDKRRFAFSDDGLRIRANQGHSVSVDLQLEARNPPAILFHGTVERFLDSIARQGLLAGVRRHVHLTADRHTAKRVGARRGRPAILEVEALRMHEAGHTFYLSANDVWLTEHVPPDFLDLPGREIQ